MLKVWDLKKGEWLGEVCYSYFPPTGTKTIAEKVKDKDWYPTYWQNQVDRHNEKNNTKLKVGGWKKQKGIGCIEEYNVFLEAERQLEKELAGIDKLKSKKHWRRYLVNKNPEIMAKQLEYVKNILFEYRNLRDNPRLLDSPNIKKRNQNVGQKSKKRRHKKQTNQYKQS